jgi:hypothetical protein
MAPPAWVCRTLMTKAEFVSPALTLMPVKSKDVTLALLSCDVPV